MAPAKVRVPAAGGLTRERVLLALDRVWHHRLGLVLAPPGAGKTTALAQYAASVDIPVAWYRAEPTDGRADVLVAYLGKALAARWCRQRTGPGRCAQRSDAIPGPR